MKDFPPQLDQPLVDPVAELVNTKYPSLPIPVLIFGKITCPGCTIKSACESIALNRGPVLYHELGHPPRWFPAPAGRVSLTDPAFIVPGATNGIGTLIVHAFIVRPTCIPKLFLPRPCDTPNGLPFASSAVWRSLVKPERRHSECK